MIQAFLTTVGFVAKRTTPVSGERPTSAPALAAEFISPETKTLSKASATLDLHGTDFTVCGWFRQISPTDNQIYFRYGDSSSADAFNWSMLNADNSSLAFFLSNGVDYFAVNSNIVPFSTSWHFFCATFNNTTKALSLSLDNGTPESVLFSGSVPVLSSTLTLGYTAEGDTNYDLSCLGLWKRVLTASEITGLYNAGHARVYSDLTTGEKVSLQNFWNLDESSDGSGAVTRVDSKTGTNLTDTGFVVSTSNVPS